MRLIAQSPKAFVLATSFKYHQAEGLGLSFLCIDIVLIFAL